MRLKSHLIDNQDFSAIEELLGEDHSSNNTETPLRNDAFSLSDDEKMEIIALKFKDIMNTLGLDLNDDSLKGTPKRVAKMFVQETFRGLNPDNFPAITLFENKYQQEDDKK